MTQIKSINLELCNEIVKELDDYFKDSSSEADVSYPSNITYASDEYFRYMFYSCLLDYGMRSKIYHENLIKTYERYPNIFDPLVVLNIRESELKNIIVENIHPRYPNVATKKWLRLSERLIKHADLATELSHLANFKELEKFIRNTDSYGQKTGGLLARIICESGISKFSVEAIPIDRHDIEISYRTGIIENTDLSQKDIESLSHSYVQAAKSANINPIDIDKYLWEIGNRFCNKKACENCPLRRYCKRK